MSRFWTHVLVAVAVALALVAFAGAAPAQMLCGRTDAVIARLAGRFGEAPKAIGSIGRDRFMQVYVAETGSWTILMTMNDGTSCILAAGEDWEDVPYAPGRRS